MASTATSLAQVDTVFSADSIEWCPFPGYEDIFICGTYQVLDPASSVTDGSDTSVAAATANASTDESTEDGRPNEDGGDDVESSKVSTQRTGRLLVYQVIDPFTSHPSLKEVQRIESNAILDTKWFSQPHNPSPKLAVADAKGQIHIYILTSLKKLEHVQSVRVADPSVLCLSLDISNRLDQLVDPKMAVSLSDGSIAVLAHNQKENENEHGHEEGSGLRVVQRWHAHDYEPWCVCWDSWDSSWLWSGGDDLKLKKWNVRDTSAPVFVNKRFDAGITTITSSPHTPHLLAVGSYDSILRLYDTRRPSRTLHEVDVGGGIWRVRFHPDPKRAGEVLVAAMHGGIKIVHFDLDVDHENGEIKVENGRIKTSFDAHTSLAYGADWSRLPPNEQGQSLIATCSFYDHAMHLWRG